MPPHILLRGLLFSAAVAATSSAPAFASDAPPPEKDHVLFMGLNLSLSLDDANCPVVDADSRSVDVQHNQRARRVLLRHVEHFGIEVLPKVSKVSVTVDTWTGERCYAPSSDPQRQAIAQQMVMQTAQSHQEEIRAREWRAAEEAAQAAQLSSPSAGSGGDGGASLQQAAASAFDAYAATLSSPQFGSSLGGAGMERDEGKLDAYLIKFKIFSPVSIRDAYAVLRLTVRDPARNGQVAQALKFMRLPNLGPKPQTVTFLAEGLPPGFTVESQKLHVYANGDEFATNLSDLRLELPAADVHQFFVLQYLTQHASGDAPVGIIPALLENDLAEHVPPEHRNRAVDLTVDASGRVTDVRLELTGWAGPDAYIISVLRQTRCYPAVVRGRPEAGTERFILTEFIP
jgi:hypothetical protein